MNNTNKNRLSRLYAKIPQVKLQINPISMNVPDHIKSHMELWAELQEQEYHKYKNTKPTAWQEMMDRRNIEKVRDTNGDISDVPDGYKKIYKEWKVGGLGSKTYIKEYIIPKNQPVPEGAFEI